MKYNLSVLERSNTIYRKVSLFYIYMQFLWPFTVKPKAERLTAFERGQIKNSNTSEISRRSIVIIAVYSKLYI